LVCGLEYTYGMVCGLEYTYGMVCGLEYTFIHTKHFQFIADKCASLHSQISHACSYRPPRPLRKPLPNLPICCPIFGLPLRCCPSTSACKHTKLHSTLFTRSLPTMSHISSIAMCILICNIHYCRLPIYSISRIVQYFSEIPVTNFRLLCL
jgi:hypothetical protein